MSGPAGIYHQFNYGYDATLSNENIFNPWNDAAITKQANNWDGLGAGSKYLSKVSGTIADTGNLLSQIELVGIKITICKNFPRHCL